MSSSIMLVIVLLTVYTVSVSSSMNATRRVLEGQISYVPELSEYVVSLLNTKWPNLYYLRCTGSLISTRHVLTAAHCVCLSIKNTSLDVIGHRIKQPSYQRITKWRDSDKYEFSHAFYYNKFEPNVDMVPFDVAVVVLVGNGITDVATIDMPVLNTDPLENFFKKDVLLFGFGDKLNKTRSEELRAITGIIHDDTQNPDAPWDCNRLIEAFCFKPALPNQNSGPGDSGGPIVTHKKRTDGTTETILVGVNHGHSGVELGYMVIANVVSFYVDWINHIMNNRGTDPPPNLPVDKTVKCCDDFF